MEILLPEEFEEAREKRDRPVLPAADTYQEGGGEDGTAALCLSDNEGEE
jgi:hypothetical protein